MAELVMPEEVSMDQGYGVMVDQGYGSEQPSLPMPDGSVEAPVAMEVPTPAEAPLSMEGGAMEGSVILEQPADGNLVADLSHEGVDDAQPQIEEAAPQTEEERLWTLVKMNPADFTSWTLLIQEVDKLDILERIHRVYDAFLAEFPLCYGYWKKYADHEGRMGSHESIISVYERAVQAVTYSVDIWMHYCSYLISKQEDPDEIRRLFERGLTYVGSDYLSHLLWDKYLEFENNQADISRVSQLLTRIVQLPIQQLDRYYSSYKALMASHTLEDLQSPEERAATAASAAAATAAAVTATTSAAIAAAEPEAAPTQEEGTETAHVVELLDAPIEVDSASIPEQVTVSAEWSEEAEYAKFIAVRDEMYKLAKEQDAKIHDFESAIRRPYFHVKPLDDLQLANWHRYLDFIEKEGDISKIVKLYERCLIACANYPEYWMRYVQFMDHEGSMEYAVDALARATQIFVKRRPEIHLFAATFKEQHGDTDGTRFEYDLLNSNVSPGLLEAIVKSANFEQRQGNTEGACSIFASAIEYEKSKEESRSLPLLYIQYARFLDQVALQTEKAREVYSDALSFLPLSKTLWEALIHFEAIRPGAKDLERLDSLIEQAISPPKPEALALSPADREELSCIYLEFVDLFGDIQAVKKAEVRHRHYFSLRKSSNESKKRPLTDASGSDRSKVMKAYSATAATVSPAQAGPPVYANGQAQWAAGYGQQGYAQPQGWQQPTAQQAPQTQAQQWGAGYTAQQAGYNAYAQYGAYAPPQQPQAPPPQQQPAAAYAGYTQSYSQQAFPQQQSYAQPAYAQQQAPAQQGYYSGYY